MRAVFPERYFEMKILNSQDVTVHRGRDRGRTAEGRTVERREEEENKTPYHTMSR
jgi:hypothetical protein